jgi:predicted MFS family arabinose efflux permease
VLLDGPIALRRASKLSQEPSLHRIEANHLREARLIASGTARGHHASTSSSRTSWRTSAQYSQPINFPPVPRSSDRPQITSQVYSPSAVRSCGEHAGKALNDPHRCGRPGDVWMNVGAAPSSELTANQRTPWGQHALLYVVFSLMGAEMHLVSPLLPAIAGSLGATIAAAATTMTAFVVVYALASPLLGIFSDRWPRKRSVIAGSIVFLVGNIGCAVAPGLIGLIAARGVTGLGAALIAPAIWAYLAERTAAHQRGRAISLGVTVHSLGQILGVPLGAALASVGGWRAPFLAVGMLMLVATITLAGRLESTPVAATPRGLSALIRPWSLPDIRLSFLTTFFMHGARLGPYTYIGAIFAMRFGMDVSALGLVTLLAGAAMMLGSLAAGTMLDRLARRGVSGTWVSVFSALLFIPFAVLASSNGQMWIALTSLALWFMCGGAFSSSQQTFLSSADPSQRATVGAWNNSMMTGGVAVGTTALGFAVAGSVSFVTITGALGLAAVTTAALLVTKQRSAAATETIHRRPSHEASAAR